MDTIRAGGVLATDQYMSGVLPSWSGVSTSWPCLRRVCTRLRLPALQDNRTPKSNGLTIIVN